MVTILAARVEVSDGGPRQTLSLGSGVLISPESHVLTAAHVVENARQLLVKTNDGVLRPAELLFSESGADLALLKLVEAAPNLSHAELGDSDQLAVGQRAYAIGSPYGLENTLSVGRISAFREFGRLYDGTISAEFIQTDAAINSGNSGGPIFDSRGRVIGIASQIYTKSGGSEGLGFAVAINTAKQLLALEERVWMGFEAAYLEADVLRALFHLDLDSGLLVQEVVKGSPADRAGIRGGHIQATIGGQVLLLGGDLIVSLGDQVACHVACLVRARPEVTGDQTVPVTLWRHGVEKKIYVDVSEARRNFLKPQAQ